MPCWLLSRDSRDSRLRRTDKWPSDTVKFPALLTMREMQIKTTTSYHSTPLRWLLSKRHWITSKGGSVEEKEALHTAGVSVISPATGVLTKLQIEWLLGIYPTDWKSAYQRDVYTPMVAATLPTEPLNVHQGRMHSGNVVCKHKVIFTFIKRNILPSATIIMKPGGITLNKPNVEQ